MKKALLLISILVLLLLTACGSRGTPAPVTEAPAEAPVPAEETPAPAVDNAWLEELPWEEDWTCLILGWKELEPEESKEALRDLLYA